MSSLVKASGSKLSQRRKSDIKWGYFFIFPQLFGVLAFVFFPLVYVLVLSLLEWNGLSSATFAGLTNYTTELTSSEFRNALSNTVYYTVMVVPTSVVLSPDGCPGPQQATPQELLPCDLLRPCRHEPPSPPESSGCGSTTLTSGCINSYLQNWFGIKGPNWLLDPKWVMPRSR